MEEITTRSPLDLIDTSFENYVRRREATAASHTVNGVPDYAFAMDYELRQKLMQIPHFYSLARKITDSLTSRMQQIVNQDGVAVGPTQFPEIYQMGVDCAHKLGIGVPNMYIVNDNTMNAGAYSVDRASPLITINSGIIERLTPGELKAVIAHECAHVHNEHYVLKCLVDAIMNSAGSLIPGGQLLISASNLALMNFWTRAGEITCDRAAMICCENIQDAINVNFKLLSGGLLNNSAEMDLDALREQMEEIFNSPTRILELGQISVNNNGSISAYLLDHPNSMRRVFADLEFAECEVFYSWRPDMKKPGAVIRSKKETDDRCRKLVNILQNK